MKGYSKKTTQKEGFLKIKLSSIKLIKFNLIKLKGTDRFLKFLHKMSTSPEICVPSYDHKWTSLGELLTSGSSVSADMTSTIEVQTY